MTANANPANKGGAAETDLLSGEIDHKDSPGHRENQARLAAYRLNDRLVVVAVAFGETRP